jgi:hypothetical protein
MISRTTAEGIRYINLKVLLDPAMAVTLVGAVFMSFNLV